VIPRSLTVPRPLPVDGDDHHTSRLASPPPLPPRRRSLPRRGLVSVVAAVLLVLGLGAGVWYINSGQFTKVPLVLAKTEEQARDRLSDAGLEVGDVEQAYSDTVRRGLVISSDPAPGSRIRSNDSVTLTISRGPQTVRVPALGGEPLDEARRTLKREGLQPGMVTREFSDEVPRGSVIRTDPEGGVEVRAESAVGLVVSKGSPVDIPDVVGDDLEAARAELLEAGLKVKVASAQINSSDIERGKVALQSPDSGREAAEGDTVTLTLSKGPVMVEVPDVVGDSVDEAREKLEGAGFDVDEDRGLLGLFGDTVKSQSVEGGDSAPKGSTITIEIR
jgi:serine/threonine-protein kinase